MYVPEAHPDAAAARVTLVVVALGRTARLVDCLASLVAHESRAAFRIVCVVNPVSGEGEGDDDGMLTASIAALDVLVVEPAMNLGWGGGLHAGRRAVGSDLFAWVQDDMVVLPGWLDALVDAADAHPGVGAFGSTRLDGAGAVGLYNAGWCEPPDSAAEWNASDPTEHGLPAEVTAFDWVTSKGLLCRTVAWDAVGGPDPSLFPLTHVDKDFCLHLRAHGWLVALVPTAHLRHAGNQSAPGLLREYLSERLTARIDARWGGIAAALPRAGAAEVDHDCTRARAADVQQWSAREAADIVVDFGRWAQRRRRAADLELVDAHAALAAARGETDALRASRSWRLTAPLRRLRRRGPTTSD